MRCNAVLDIDQADMRVAIKEKLSIMIEDHYCNTVVKPALIQLARGNSAGFSAARCDPRATRAIIQRNEKAFKKVLRSVKFRQSSSAEFRALESEYVEKVRPHARNYVMRWAGFLMSADHGLSADDMINDLLLLAMRAFRWYYPFRSGLHMLNTMRATITNRGKSMVNYNVADCRRRLMMMDNGDMYNRESSGGYEAALNVPDPRADPHDITTDLLVQRVALDPAAIPVVNFVNDDAAQDRFVSWASHRVGVGFRSMDDMLEHLHANRLSYEKLLACYLKQPYTSVRKTLTDLRTSLS